jgi:hypothetical protein
MILGQVSYLDCIVFLLFLGPQLLLRVGLIGTIICLFHALPFLGSVSCLSLFLDT